MTLAEEALAHLGAVVRVAEPHGRRHGRLRLGARLLCLACRSDDRGGAAARPVARGLDPARRADDARDGEAAPRRGMHPVELREMVTSPGGTTIAAIHELEIAGVRAAFLNAIQAAMTRSRELAAEHKGNWESTERGSQGMRDAQRPRPGRRPAPPAGLRSQSSHTRRPLSAATGAATTAARSEAAAG